MLKIGKTWSQSNPFQPGPHSQVHGPSQTPLTLFCFTSLGNSFKSWSHRFGSQDMEHTQCSYDPGEEYVDNLWQRSCTLSNLVSWLAGAIPGHLAESLLWMTTWSARGSVAERTCELMLQILNVQLVKGRGKNRKEYLRETRSSPAQPSWQTHSPGWRSHIKNCLLTVNWIRQQLRTFAALEDLPNKFKV